jgi:hypothetical protein
MANLVTALMNEDKNMIKLVIIVATATSLAACLHNDRLDYDKRVAINEMIEQQIYDKEAAINPPKGVVNGLDGGVAEQVINNHRSGNKEAASAERDISFKVEAD